MKVCAFPDPEVGDSETTVGVAEVVPVPVSVEVWVLPVAFPELSVTTIVAVWLPADEGVNVTEMVQLAAAAKLVPQLLVSANSLGSVPPTATLAIARAAEPELLRVNVCAALVVPFVCVANVRELGVSAAVGVPPPLEPVPVRVTVCVEPVLPELSIT